MADLLISHLVKLEEYRVAEKFARKNYEALLAHSQKQAAVWNNALSAREVRACVGDREWINCALTFGLSSLTAGRDSDFDTARYAPCPPSLSCLLSFFNHHAYHQL